MRPMQPRFPHTFAVLGLILLASTILAARTYTRIFEASAENVYAAALKAAETDGRVTIIDENAKQKRMHLRVNIDSIAFSEPMPGQPPSGPPITADASNSQGLGVLLTVVVIPNGTLQSSMTVEAQSSGAGLAAGRYPGRFPGDRRNADEFQQRRAACMMLVRTRSILKLPNRKIGDLMSMDGCE